MRLYIAGPMRGLPLHNFPAFRAAGVLLNALEIDWISPAEMDEDEGFDPSRDKYDNAALHAALRRDLLAILQHQTSGIVRLKGWQASEGVAIEMTVNAAIGGRLFDVVYDDDGRMVGIEEV